MKTKTSELTGKALDWIVTCLWIKAREEAGEYIKPWWKDLVLNKHHADPYSTEWMWGGPIIERELHNLFKWNQLDPSAPEMWCGVHNRKTDSGIYAINVDGPTPLIAAMRCFVAAKLGNEVDVPEELCA